MPTLDLEGAVSTAVDVTVTFGSGPLHGQVHLGALVGHPLGTLSADFTAPFTCPPSP